MNSMSEDLPSLDDRLDVSNCTAGARPPEKTLIFMLVGHTRNMSYAKRHTPAIFGREALLRYS